MMNNSVSVIVPTLNAADRLPSLLERLQTQTLKPQEIYVIDSSSDDDTAIIASRYDGVIVKTIARATFNHGTTRHLALLESSGDFVCFLTDDALPVSADFLANLLIPMADNSVAMVSGRQVARPDARRYTQLVQEYNYPLESNVRSADDLKALGIKTFFASDACALYRRTSYLLVGGFQEVNTNEDMLIAADFIHAGFKVGYAADAEVVHSHALTFREQYLRNRAIGYFLEEHSKDLSCPSELGEGGNLVRSVVTQLIKEKRPGEIVSFGFDCVARLTGNRAGRRTARRENEK